MPFTTTAVVGIAAGAALAGAGVAAFGQIQAGRQAEQTAKINAQIQANQAKQEEFAASAEADVLLERGRRFKARQRTQAAGGGLGISSGLLAVFQETAQTIAQDVLNIGFRGQQRASFLRSQGQITLARGQQQRRASIISAGSSLLSGASSSLITSRRLG